MKKYSLITFLIFYAFLLVGCASNSNIKKDNSHFSSIQNDLTAISDVSEVAGFPKPSQKIKSLVNHQTLSFNPIQTEFNSIYAISYEQMTWVPTEDFFDAYIYDIKNQKYVCKIENCYKQAFGVSSYDNLGKLWRFWSKDNAYYLVNKENYAICDSEGFEYVNGYLTKTSFKNIYKTEINWKIKNSELNDYYIYSKKDSEIIAVLKNCYIRYFNKGISGWGDNIKNAYGLITTDNKQYLIENSDYYICNKDGYEYVYGDAYKIEFPDVFGDSISVSKGKVTVVAEPFRELFYICKRLSNFNGRWETDDSAEYLSDINQYFGEYKNHPAVVFLNEHLHYFEQDEFSMTAPLYELADNKLCSGEVCTFNSGEKFEFYNYFNLLVDFAQKSNFKAFFNSHKEYYKSCLIENGFKSFGCIEKFNYDFLKQSKKTAYIIYMHKLGWASVNAQNKEVYKINLQVVNYSQGKNQGIGLAHELAHPIMNPVMIKLYESDLKYRFDILFNKNAGSMAVYGYPEPVNYWCDGFVRAAAGLAGDETNINYYLNEQESYVGFAMVPQMYEKLKELSKTNYKSFDDLYDELYKFFDKKLPR